MSFNPSSFKQSGIGGVWTEWMGGKWKVAKSGSDEHTAIRESVIAPFKQLVALDQMPKGKMRSLMAEVTAKAILVDWDDVTDDDGNDLPYSVEAATKMLLETPELTEYISMYSVNHANYRAGVVDKNAKKSQPSSYGNESGDHPTKSAKKT
jgi:hypothetical protein